MYIVRPGRNLHSHADVASHGYVWTSMGFAHNRHHSNLSKRSIISFRAGLEQPRIRQPTPLAVRIGFALNLGSNAGFNASGTAAIMSTSLGLPWSLCFFETVFRSVLRLIASWVSCAFARMLTISEHVLMSASFCDGAPILADIDVLEVFGGCRMQLCSSSS